eukprot:7132528-Alexandrium_andersonii.AAC.1
MKSQFMRFCSVGVGTNWKSAESGVPSSLAFTGQVSKATLPTSPKDMLYRSSRRDHTKVQQAGSLRGS